MYSFIYSGYLCSASATNLLRGPLNPATAKEKCLKKLAQGRHIDRGVPHDQECMAITCRPMYSKFISSPYIYTNIIC